MAATNTFSYPLYDYAVGWFGRVGENPLDFIAPFKGMPGKTGTYKRYPQGYAMRAEDTRRARFAPAHAIEIGAEDVPYLLEDHSLRIGVDDSDIKPGAGTVAEASEQMVQADIKSLLSTFRRSTIKAGYDFFRSQVAAQVGKGAWSGATSEPIAELLALLEEYENANGIMPNRIQFSRKAWNIIGNNAAVLDLVAYNSAKTLTAPLLIDLLKLDPALTKVQVASVPVATAKPAADVPFVGTNVLGADVWLTYVDDGEQIGNMTGMLTLHAGDESPVESVISYRDEPAHTTWYEVGLHRQFAVTAPSCNMRIAVS